jgi:hypothetical protein
MTPRAAPPKSSRRLSTTALTRRPWGDDRRMAIVQRQVPTQSGGTLFMTVGRYLSPSGTPLGGKGLAPDDRVIVFPESREPKTRPRTRPRWLRNDLGAPRRLKASRARISPATVFFPPVTRPRNRSLRQDAPSPPPVPVPLSPTPHPRVRPRPSPSRARSHRLRLLRLPLSRRPAPPGGPRARGATARRDRHRRPR